MSFEPVNPKGRGNQNEAMLAFEARGFRFTATLCRNLNLTEREAKGRKLGLLFDLRISATSMEDPELTCSVYKRGFHEIQPPTTPMQTLRQNLSKSAEGSWIVIAKEAMRGAKKAKTRVVVEPKAPVANPFFEVTLTIPVVRTGTLKVQAANLEAARDLAIQLASDSRAAGFVDLPSAFTRSEFALAGSLEDSVLQVPA
jgi:hypothetical protein